LRAPPAKQTSLAAALRAGAALSVLAAVACGGSDEPEPLFGAPVPLTGLSSDQCTPSCACLDFVSRDFTPAQIAQLRQWQNTAALTGPSADPYQEPVPDRPEGVCAIVVDDLAAKTYHPQDFSSAEAAEAAGAILTHHDACGLCSTLADLAVYAEDRDVGSPVRECGLANFDKPFEDLVACIEGIGFTNPCARIWAYNVLHTREKCLNECIRQDYYHEPDGTLSSCLACDERESGPWFKAIAGRTRRNTGLASSICRPCSEVLPVAHDYPFD